MEKEDIFKLQKENEKLKLQVEALNDMATKLNKENLYFRERIVYAAGRNYSDCIIALKEALVNCKYY